MFILLLNAKKILDPAMFFMHFLLLCHVERGFLRYRKEGSAVFGKERSS